MTSVYGPSCDRTRALLSRQLDTQLSELERRAVALHTVRCVACRRFEDESRWITEELRAAPMAPLPRPVSITVPRRSFPTRVVANVASAAALLVIAVMGVTAASDAPDRAGGSSTQSLAPDTRMGEIVLREIRREGLRTGELQVLPVETHVKPALPAIDA